MLRCTTTAHAPSLRCLPRRPRTPPAPAVAHISAGKGTRRSRAIAWCHQGARLRVISLGCGASERRGRALRQRRQLARLQAQRRRVRVHLVRRELRRGGRHRAQHAQQQRRERVALAGGALRHGSRGAEAAGAKSGVSKAAAERQTQVDVSQRTCRPARPCRCRCARPQSRCSCERGGAGRERGSRVRLCPSRRAGGVTCARPRSQTAAMVQLEELPSAPAPAAPSAALRPCGGGLEKLTLEELKAEVQRLSKLRDAAEARARVRSPLSDVDEEQPAGAEADEDAAAGCAAGRQSGVSSSRLTRPRPQAVARRPSASAGPGGGGAGHAEV